MFAGRHVYSVSELTLEIKAVLERTPSFHSVLVRGEISNFKHHTSGHMYFTLKDAHSRLKCVMFRGKNRKLTFRPEDGLNVVAGGTISLYEAAGEYQLYVEELFPAGQGALYLAFEQLKERLRGEGLFDEARKRPLPYLPRTVGIVTSPTGAAVRDILSVLRRRFPTVNIVLAPAIVQGDEGPASVAQGITRLNARRDVDVMIVGRGGGSLEELWTFNDERVARAIAASRIPVISAVGHETDVTIADFVADRRAPTPSAAAEMAVPDWGALVRDVQALRERLITSQTKYVHSLRERLRYLQQSPALSRPLDRLRQQMQQVDDVVHRLVTVQKHALSAQRQRLDALVAQLDSLSPLATLSRGYAICRRKDADEVLRDAADVQAGDLVDVRLHRGEFTCRVEGEPRR